MSRPRRLAGSALVAQAFFGSTVGTITDASGGAVRAAKVTLTSLGTNEERVVVDTDSNGDYRFVNLASPRALSAHCGERGFRPAEP